MSTDLDLGRYNRNLGLVLLHFSQTERKEKRNSAHTARLSVIPVTQLNINLSGMSKFSLSSFITKPCVIHHYSYS